MELYNLSASELSKKLRSKECSAVEITSDTFKRIDAVENKVDAYITLLKDSAL